MADSGWIVVLGLVVVVVFIVFCPSFIEGTIPRVVFAGIAGIAGIAGAAGAAVVGVEKTWARHRDEAVEALDRHASGCGAWAPAGTRVLGSGPRVVADRHVCVL